MVKTPQTLTGEVRQQSTLQVEYISASFNALSDNSRTPRGMHKALWNAHVRSVNRGHFENALRTMADQNASLLTETLISLAANMHDAERDKGLASVSLMRSDKALHVSDAAYEERLQRELKDFHVEAEMARNGADEKQGSLWEGSSDMGKQIIDALNALFQKSDVTSTLGAMDKPALSKALVILCGWLDAMLQTAPCYVNEDVFTVSYAGYEALLEVRHSARKGALRILHDAGVIPAEKIPDIMTELRKIHMKWKEVNLRNPPPQSTDLNERMRNINLWETMRRLHLQMMYFQTHLDLADTLAYASREKIIAAMQQKERPENSFNILPPAARIMEISRNTQAQTDDVFAYDGFGQWALYGQSEEAGSSFQLQLTNREVNAADDIFCGSVKAKSGVIVFADGRLSLGIPGRSLGLLPDTRDTSTIAKKLWNKTSASLEGLMNAFPDLFFKKDVADSSLFIKTGDHLQIVTTAETDHATLSTTNVRTLLMQHSIALNDYNKLRVYEKIPPTVTSEEIVVTELSVQGEHEYQSKHLPHLSAGEVMRRLRALGMEARSNGSSHMVVTNPRNHHTHTIGTNTSGFEKKSEHVPLKFVMVMLRNLGIPVTEFYEELAQTPN